MECSSITLLADHSVTIRQKFSSDLAFRIVIILFYVIPGIFFAQLARFPQAIHIQFLAYGALMMYALILHSRNAWGMFQRPVFINNGIKFKGGCTYRFG